MSAPLRIRPPAVKAVAATQPVGEDAKAYLDRLVKLIPAEVLSLYLTGLGFISKTSVLLACGWAIFCLAGVVIVKAFGTSDRMRDLPPDWRHVILSSIAFVLWIYSTGGPFEQLGLFYPNIGSLLILAFTFFAPYFYVGHSSPLS